MNKTGKSVIRYLLLTFFSLLYLVPVVMMIFGSLKTPAEAVKFDLAPPEVYQFENYSYVIERGRVFTGYLNSLIISGSATALTLLFGSFAGIYVGRTISASSRAVYNYFIFGLTLCFQTATTFGVLKVLNLFGSHLGVILIFVGMNLPFTVMTFSSFIKGIPREIDEAGMIDGCRSFSLVFKIILPIMKPIFMTNLIIVAIGCWNNFMVPLFYLISSKKATIPLMVYNFYGRYERNWNYVFAMLVLTIVPIVILYLALQKHIVAGMTSGAVKG